MSAEPEYTIGGFHDVLMQLHDASMSKDTLRACEGRFAKPMVNMLIQWMDEEMRRGTAPQDILLAAQAGSLSMFFTTLLNMTRQGMASADIARVMREHYIKMYDQNVEKLSELGVRK